MALGFKTMDYAYILEVDKNDGDELYRNKEQALL